MRAEPASPPSRLSHRRGSLRSRSRGSIGGGEEEGKEKKKKKNLHKKTDDQTHRAAGRHFAQQQGEPERAAPAKHPEERERERERETRDTRTGELDRKKYP